MAVTRIEVPVPLNKRAFDNLQHIARGLLKWTRDDLAARSGVFANTIKNFENGTSGPKRSTLLKWRRALEKGDVIFIDADAEAGPGVRLRDERK